MRPSQSGPVSQRCGGVVQSDAGRGSLEDRVGGSERDGPTKPERGATVAEGTQERNAVLWVVDRGPPSIWMIGFWRRGRSRGPGWRPAERR